MVKYDDSYFFEHCGYLTIKLTCYKKVKCEASTVSLKKTSVSPFVPPAPVFSYSRSK